MILHSHDDDDFTCDNPFRMPLTIVYSCIIVLVVLLNTSIFVSLKPFVPSTRRRSNLEVLVMYLAVFDLLASVMLVSQVYQVCTNHLFYKSKSIHTFYSFQLLAMSSAFLSPLQQTWFPIPPPLRLEKVAIRQNRVNPSVGKFMKL